MNIEKKIELPYGKTEGYIKSVIELWETYDEEIKSGKRTYTNNASDYDEYAEDDEYIDRYIYDNDLGDVCFCISTEKSTGITWISEDVCIHGEDGDYDYFYIQTLREML